jgi:hypothetical protein
MSSSKNADIGSFNIQEVNPDEEISEGEEDNELSPMKRLDKNSPLLDSNDDESNVFQFELSETISKPTPRFDSPNEEAK